MYISLESSSSSLFPGMVENHSSLWRKEDQRNPKGHAAAIFRFSGSTGTGFILCDRELSKLTADSDLVD